MNYGIYKNARNASWQCLIDCNVTELPIKPVQIAKQHGLRCIVDNSILDPGESGRITGLTDNSIAVVINNNQSVQRQRFTVMHELGHCLLGHLGDTPLSRSYSSIRPEEEIAADRFAVDLLMPACVLWGLDIHTADDITKLCNVSVQAAKIRSERMEVLYKRNMFLSHPLERRVYQQFQQLINSHK